MAKEPAVSTTRDILNPQIPETGEMSLRPLSLHDFVGQHKLKESLGVFIKAAMSRNTPLDHVLFHGPPGLGKTTLAQIIARELGVSIKISSGPMMSKPGDLAAILTNLKPHDVLFIDEIHRLPNIVEEVLYPAMEDFYIDVIIGDGPAARTVKIDLPHFTLIGATTRPGLLTNPLRDRFGIPMKLSFYSFEELQAVLARNSVLLGMGIVDEAKSIIARCARGTPRIAIRLLKRVRDFAQVQGEKTISVAIVSQTFRSLQIDELGLDELDRSYIRYIIEHYGAGPVGIDTIAAGLSEDKDTIEDTIEPHLMQIGFVARTPRGRTLTQRCIDYAHANWLPVGWEIHKKAE